ncbi:MAG: flippase [Planctomycetales bacterium]|nr:flippase [Planctomycetales bacterium]
MELKAKRGSAARTSVNAMMLLAGTMFRMVASFAFVLYSSNVLHADGYGKYSIAIHYFELFLSLSSTGVAIMLTRDAARWLRATNRLLTCGIVLGWLLCAVSPIVLFSIGYGFGYSSDTAQALGIGCIALFPSVACNVIEAVFVARERADLVTLGTAVESVLRLALSFLVLWFGWGLLELMWVQVVVRTAQMLIYAIAIRRLVGFQPDWRWSDFRRFFLSWRVFAAENWMATIYTSLDVVVLSALASESAVGVYSVAGKFVRLGSVVARSFTTAVYPVMSRMQASNKVALGRLYRHTIRVMCLLAFPAVIGVDVLARRIVALLFRDASYLESAPVLQILIWLLVLEFLNPFLSHVLFAKGLQHRSMFVAGISLTTNLIAMWLFVSYWGATGAAAACVLSGTVATIGYCRFAMDSFEIRDMLSSMGRTLLAAGGMGLVIFFMRDASWLWMAVVSALVYAILALIVQAVRKQDLLFFRTVWITRATA